MPGFRSSITTGWLRRSRTEITSRSAAGLLLHDDDLDAIRPLLRAAHAHPRLRELFPSVTHLTLVRLKVDPFDTAGDEVLILLSRQGTYRVDAARSNAAREVSTVDDAVEAAVSRLP